MRNIEMEQSNIKDDPLTRIQREIIEVTERENEFRKVHPTYNRHVSESHISYNHTNGSNGSEDESPPKTLSRAVSQNHLLGSSPKAESTSTNGISRRYKPHSTQKGIMQRFIASKGRLSMSSIATGGSSPISNKMFMSSPGITPAVVPKQQEGKPIRKGFVPVEEKIQKELKDLKDRESELKRQRKRSLSSYQLDFNSLDLSDKESDQESDDDIPMPGKLRVAKSIGELYEALGEGRSPSPPVGASGPESYGSLKPAKSLAQLCDLGPDEEALAPSSTKLIAKWESLIQQKQESGAA